MYYLRCSDRQCCGTATYNTTNGKIEESVKCSKTFENHNYIKESLIRKKFEKEEISPSEIENNEEYQEIFFKYILSIHPNILYYDIIYLLHEKYNTKKIVYKQTIFNNYKNGLKHEFKFNIQRENRIDDIKFENENLLKVKIEYYSKDKPNEKNTKRIFGIDES